MECIAHILPSLIVLKGKYFALGAVLCKGFEALESKESL
jgi:hypothetical protein